MKVYKVTLIAVDANNELNEAEIQSVIENARYPNHCMYPHVISVDSVELGPWDDDLPINGRNTFDAEVERLFPGTKVVL